MEALVSSLVPCPSAVARRGPARASSRKAVRGRFWGRGLGKVTCEAYQADDFVLSRQVGGMTVRTRTGGFSFDEDDTDSFLGDGKINFYSARFASNIMPQNPVLLKEFTGSAVPLGERELRAYDQLLGAPLPSTGEGGWANAFPLAEAAGEPPLAPLMGSFRSAAVVDPQQALKGFAEVAASMGATVDLDGAPGEGGGDGEGEGEENALWLLGRVGRRLQSMADYPGAGQQVPVWDNMSIFRLARGEEGEEKRRWRFIRSIIRGGVAALAWVHRRGVVHRSLSASSFLLSTVDDMEANRLKVRLTNFGLAGDITPGSTGIRQLGAECGEEDEGAVADWADTRALGLATLEVVFSSLSAAGPGDTTSQDTLERLLALKDDNIEEFREFCAEEEPWEEAVGLLDSYDGAGWAVVGELLRPTQSLTRTLDSPFFSNLHPLDPSLLDGGPQG